MNRFFQKWRYWRRRPKPTTGRIRMGAHFNACLWSSVGWLVLCALALGLAHRFAVHVAWREALGIWFGGMLLICSVIEFIFAYRQMRMFALQKVFQVLVFCLLLAGLCGSPVAGVVYFIAR